MYLYHCKNNKNNNKNSLTYVEKGMRGLGIKVRRRTKYKGCILYLERDKEKMEGKSCMYVCDTGY